MVVVMTREYTELAQSYMHQALITFFSFFFIMLTKKKAEKSAFLQITMFPDHQSSPFLLAAYISFLAFTSLIFS
jgi:hypothetical protein